MAWFRIHNHALLPVHVAISTAGVIQYWKNDISAQTGYTEFDVKDAIWHDLTVIPSNGSNQLDPAKHNAIKITEIVTGTVAGLVAAASIPLAIVSGGTTTAITIGAAVTAAGAATTITDIVGSSVQYALSPTVISNLYAPHGYNFDITGGRISGDIIEGSKLKVTGYQPVMVAWHNNTTGTHGVEQAKH